MNSQDTTGQQGSPDSWSDLFLHGSRERSVSIQVQVLRKRGHALLVLPGSAKAAIRGLSLYPAQASRARLLKNGLRLWLALRIPWKINAATLHVSPTDGFLRFLSSAAGLQPERYPQFAILAGNPAAPGRRFVLLLFDTSLAPVAVVKAGLSTAARELIEKETAFLHSLPPNTMGVPNLGSSYSSDRVKAFALDYVPGKSPAADDVAVIDALLSAWIDSHKRIAIGELPVWQRLAEACGSNSLFQRLNGALASTAVQPALYHGDFTPWNIKLAEDARAATVLDWERGERIGMPAWDWFHYLMQPAILVQRLPVGDLVMRMESVLASAPFTAYASRASVAKITKELAAAYLLYNCEVIRPSEGLATTRQLLQALVDRWKL